jgi:hypothetical protein
VHQAVAARGFLTVGQAIVGVDGIAIVTDLAVAHDHFTILACLGLAGLNNAVAAAGCLTSR